MANGLREAIEALHLQAQQVYDKGDAWIEAGLEFHAKDNAGEVRPRQRASRDPSTIKRKLAEELLSPPTEFSAQWLNKWQQRWDAPVNYAELADLAPTQSRTVTRFTREGLEGRVTGYKEVTVPASSANAKNSTSLLRRPASRAEFVRGAAGFFPFTPGGLDGVDAIAEYEDQVQVEERAKGGLKSSGLDRIINFGTERGLLEVAPGFTRGLNFVEKKLPADDGDAQDIENTLEEVEPTNRLFEMPDSVTNDHIESEKSNDTISDDEEEDDDDLADLLPVEFPALEPHSQLLASSQKKGGREWAHVVDINREISNFKELVPEMARQWPFELDTFQKEAVYHLECGDSVFVAAHTSAGETVVAEYAIARAAKHMTKAIYTSPIKALSNQKFRDFRNEFNDVGMLTADVQIAPEAS